MADHHVVAEDDGTLQVEVAAAVDEAAATGLQTGGECEVTAAVHDGSGTETSPATAQQAHPAMPAHPIVSQEIGTEMHQVHPEPQRGAGHAVHARLA